MISHKNGASLKSNYLLIHLLLVRTVMVAADRGGQPRSQGISGLIRGICEKRSALGGDDQRVYMKYKVPKLLYFSCDRARNLAEGEPWNPVKETYCVWRNYFGHYHNLWSCGEHKDDDLLENRYLCPKTHASMTGEALSPHLKEASQS